MAKFDVANEKWIPVLDGVRQEKIGLKDALKRSHEVKLQADPFALVGILYLLILVAKKAYSLAGRVPEYDDGRFDPAVIDAYFDKYNDRFNLLDEKYPFLQCPGMEGDPKPIAEIVIRGPSGSNATLNYSASQVVDTLSFGESVLAMLSQQVWSIKRVANPVTAEKYGLCRNAPAVGGMVCLADGATVYDSLWANFPWEDVNYPSAPWEREPDPPSGPLVDKKPEEVGPDGGLLCLLPLRMLLAHDEERITGVWWAMGHWVRVHGRQGIDLTVTKAVKDHVYRIRFDPSKSMLREISALTQWISEKSPAVARVKAGEVAGGSGGAMYAVDSYTIVEAWTTGSDSKIRYGPSEVLQFVPEFIADNENVEAISRAVRIANEVATDLFLSFGRVGKLDKSKAQLRYSVEGEYWAVMSEKFASLVNDLYVASTIKDKEQARQEKWRLVGNDQDCEWGQECRGSAVSCVSRRFQAIFVNSGTGSGKDSRTRNLANMLSKLKWRRRPGQISAQPPKPMDERSRPDMLKGFGASFLQCLYKPSGGPRLRRAQDVSSMVDVSENREILSKIVKDASNFRATPDELLNGRGIVGRRGSGIGRIIRRIMPEGDDGIVSSRIWSIVDSKSPYEALRQIEALMGRMMEAGMSPRWITLAEELCAWAKGAYKPQRDWIEDFFGIDSDYVDSESFVRALRETSNVERSYLRRSGGSPNLVARVMGDRMPRLGTWDSKCCAVVAEAFSLSEATENGDLGSVLSRLDDESRLNAIVSMSSSSILQASRDLLRYAASKGEAPNWKQFLDDLKSWSPCWRAERSSGGEMVPGVGAKWVASFFGK